MKKIRLNEAKYNMILEYAGYMSYFDKFIPYISNRIKQEVMNNLLKNNIDINKHSKKEIIQYYYKNYDKNLEKIKSVIVDTKRLRRFGIKNIGYIEIDFIVDNNSAASYSSTDSKLTKKGRMNCIYIDVNIIYVLLGGDIESTINHEFTHAYERMKRLQKYGNEKVKADSEKTFYKNNNDSIVNTIVYDLSKTEINAHLSELFYLLMSKKANYNNYKEIIMNTNFYNEYYEEIIKIKNEIINNNDAIYEIINFIKNNPEYSKVFPSVRNKNLNAFRKRMIKVMDFKLNYINNKINRFIKNKLM